jgi:hypothetical protein
VRVPPHYRQFDEQGRHDSLDGDGRDALGAGYGAREIRVSQRAGDRRFETIVQLLEDATGGDLIRFAYSTGGTARRGPVTLRGRDLERLRAELESRPRLAEALGLAPQQSPTTRE